MKATATTTPTAIKRLVSMVGLFGFAGNAGDGWREKFRHKFGSRYAEDLFPSSRSPSQCLRTVEYGSPCFEASMTVNPRDSSALLKVFINLFLYKSTYMSSFLFFCLLDRCTTYGKVLL